MPIEWTPLTATASVAVTSLLYVLGGLRFRRWAIDDRPGIPRYSPSVETVILWLVYSGGVAVTIVVLRQTLRVL